MMVRVVAHFGFTANGSSDDGRERTILTPISPTYAAEILRLQEAGARSRSCIRSSRRPSPSPISRNGAQHNVELTARLEEREAELAAARAANRELTKALNQRA
jgi:hypothetical protein